MQYMFMKNTPLWLLLRRITIVYYLNKTQIPFKYTLNNLHIYLPLGLL